MSDSCSAGNAHSCSPCRRTSLAYSTTNTSAAALSPSCVRWRGHPLPCVPGRLVPPVSSDNLGLGSLVSLIPLIKSPFERGQSGRRFILVVLVDLLPDVDAVNVTFLPQRCLHSLSSHVSGYRGVNMGWSSWATRKRKTYFTHSH